jgi:hypothetical protein
MPVQVRPPAPASTCLSRVNDRVDPVKFSLALRKDKTNWSASDGCAVLTATSSSPCQELEFVTRAKPFPK